MKKSVVLILSMCMLAGCSSVDTVPDTSVTEAPTTTTDETIIEETEADVYERTQEMIDAAWEERLEYNGSGSDEIPELVVIMDASVCMSDISIDNDVYTELETAVDEYEAEVYAADVDMYRSHVLRCDNRVVCISSQIVKDQDRYTEYITWNYTGERLCFSDVIRDYDVFINTVSPLILESLEDVDDVDAQEILSSLIYATDDVDFEFCMTDDSLCFFVEYSMSDEEGNVISDRSVITVPYREYADLFEPEYLPGDGIMMWESDYYDIEDTMGHSYAYGDYYNEVVLGTNVSGLNGRNYMLIIMDNSTAAFEVDIDQHCTDDYPCPIIAIYDIDAGEIVYSEEIDWGVDWQYGNELGSFGDDIAFIEEHT